MSGCARSQVLQRHVKTMQRCHLLEHLPLHALKGSYRAFVLCSWLPEGLKDCCLHLDQLSYFLLPPESGPNEVVQKRQGQA